MEDTPLRHDDSDATTTTRTENPGANLSTDDVEYTAIVAPYDDAPDECTIFPAGLTEAEMMTTWVSAQEGAYVSLEAMR
ncbi:hypothetical protein E6P09_01350 [Haloferax mediterranei ATCC 33500]|uniref:DUF7511 domain-containing protein n=1 Tax=Haloferax mediterranei (strain ATCC 33500 / DSM 1411 / JCM 8866 / NBRC 14739 / NCIMB 2177 / R-4) TaxID=523841 RepID=I3R6A2_HALMT|nr:hypothetical protein [Haloferax mediterranei]AFK19762.1 hypothetical protein HFX_2070 [Haloferax mediterranei ATCC 33500]AHZ23148.1 hypothetical protein BM92_11095 [Haloferax mediterranei ATCC 33500]EMA00084.1 hypothetical protein C439_12128 [Haloferax mediterranei ATCC 33500]MDX5987493.1 hypothetical protein [Haloferax mediterranei ATCC 33500]QCQ73993.1 hypothetical protein E6P09_01350 [Haloferax mediterranei ATCC 33500]